MNITLILWKRKSQSSLFLCEFLFLLVSDRPITGFPWALMMSSACNTGVSAGGGGSVVMETSNFAHVIFQNVGKSFLPQAALECHYTLTSFITPHPKDWVGIFKVSMYYYCIKSTNIWSVHGLQHLDFHNTEMLFVRKRYPSIRFILSLFLLCWNLISHLIKRKWVHGNFASC